MVIVVKWRKIAPGPPIFSRKFAVATIVLIIFVVYVANLGKMMNVDGQVEYIADEGNVEKFRFVAQLLISSFPRHSRPNLDIVDLQLHERENSITASLATEQELKLGPQAMSRGLLPEQNGVGCAARYSNPYPIYEQNPRFSLPYL